MSRTFQIHEFAELAGVTVKALHHYDWLGLLKPARSGTGYRVYTERDLERLEQIVALKFIGLPLKQIKALLHRSAPPIADALRLQRTALEEQHRRLDLAIRAIEKAGREIGRGTGSDTLALKTLIAEIGMQDDLDIMKKYFSEHAWPEGRRYYERWPSEDWQQLYRDLEASLDEHPAGDRAQSLAARWVALANGDAGRDPEMRAGLWAAWIDRGHWPPRLQQKMAALHLEDVTTFIREAVWVFMERQRPAPTESMPPARVNAARMALFQEMAAALGDADRDRARDLVTRWRALLDAETGGDEETKTMMMKAWADRQSWPSGMRRYVASLYDVPVATWERVAHFIDQTSEANVEWKGLR